LTFKLLNSVRPFFPPLLLHGFKELDFSVQLVTFVPEALCLQPQLLDFLVKPVTFVSPSSSFVVQPVPLSL
jgi:hypothetical protein